VGGNFVEIFFILDGGRNWCDHKKSVEMNFVGFLGTPFIFAQESCDILPCYCIDFILTGAYFLRILKYPK
jgi:hypothetical protein